MTLLETSSKTLEGAERVLVIIAVALGIYVAYRLYTESKKVGEAIADSSQAVADKLVSITHPGVKVLATVKLPTGQIIDVNNIPGGVRADFTFDYRGVAYILTGRGSDGHYNAMATSETRYTIQ